MKRKTSKEEFILVAAISGALLVATFTLVFFSHTIYRIMNQGLGSCLAESAVLLIVARWIIKKSRHLKSTIQDIKYILK